MDPTVPAGAARLLDFVRLTEVSTKEPHGYEVIYGFNQDKLPKPLTSMTVDEVQAAQAVIDEAMVLARATPAHPVPLPRPEPIVVVQPVPAPIGHNGGPVLEPDKPLSPIEQMNKPVQGAKGNLAAGGVAAAALVLASTAGWLPAAWTNDPDAMLALGIVVPWVVGAMSEPG